ncbi:MAG: hypothetical protein IT381_19920 [Deltaproteobacteria bacterium]|nr:hypothetical protein [Deltaproteobacteria bacterium]
MGDGVKGLELAVRSVNWDGVIDSADMSRILSRDPKNDGIGKVYDAPEEVYLSTLDATFKSSKRYNQYDPDFAAQYLTQSQLIVLRANPTARLVPTEEGGAIVVLGEAERKLETFLLSTNVGDGKDAEKDRHPIAGAIIGGLAFGPPGAIAGAIIGWFW